MIESQNISLPQTNWVKTTCPYCGTGCGVEAKVDENGKTTIRGDEEHPTNQGLLCSKGTALGSTLGYEGRLLKAKINGQTASMEKSLSYVAAKFQQCIAEHGPDSVAFYVSGQLLTEDYFVANKLMKGFIGSSNIDSNSRLCMSSAVAGHKRAFGTDTVPGCYEDLELAELVTLVGSNLAWCHPIVFQRLKKAKEQNPNLKVVVIDPRKTDSCDIADQHLAIDAGSDVALFNGLLRYLAEHDALDKNYIKQHCEGFEQALRAAQNDLSYAEIAQCCGLELEELEAYYALYSKTQACVTVFSQGVNQSTRGVDKVNAIINCHLATGKIGKPGATPFSITGQPNAMGGREVGGMANMLAAHMEYIPEHLNAIAKFWNSDKLSQQPGTKAIEMFDKVANGEIKALWIMGTNPAVSLPNSGQIRAALETCPFVVVSDCMEHTDTTAYAHVLLPAATWGEKSGTVTNSERCISRQRAFLPLPEEVKPDWWLISQVAQRMGFASAFPYQHSADIFAEHAKMTTLEQETQARDLDLGAMTGLKQIEYDELKPTYWPVTKDGTKPRFFANGGFYTASTKGQFIALKHKAAANQCSEDFPLVLNSGRVRDQWHTMTRTGSASQLNSHIIEPLLAIHPDDAKQGKLIDGQVVQVSSQVGKTKVRLKVDAGQKRGNVFMPIHWNDQFASEGVVSRLVNPNFDALSGQPESKFTPVSVSAWEYKTEAMLLSPVELKQLPAHYWVKQKLEQGYLYHLADALTPNELKAQIKAYFTRLIHPQFIDYSDDINQIYRSGIISDGQLLASFCVMSKDKANKQSWLENLLSQPLNDHILRGILSGSSPEPDLGKIVCSCHQVREQTIKDAICEGQLSTAEQVGKACKAGTNCGSCVPEIKSMIEHNNMATHAATM